MAELIDIATPADHQEGTFAILRSWLKSPGDAVCKDEPVAELETDKVAVEVCAPADGVLHALVREIDEEIEPGSVIAQLAPAAAGDKARPGSDGGGENAADGAAKTSPATPADETKVPRHSPAVRRLLNEHNLAAETITGTGKHGRLTKQDVLDHLETAPSRAAQPAPSVLTAPGAPPATGAAAAPAPGAHPALSGAGVVQVPHTPMRKQIAAHMHKSVNVAPHVTALFETDLTAIAADRRARKAAYAEKGVNLTYTAYFVRAAIEALKAVPEVNSRFHEDRIDIYKSLNIGVGVALGDDGLVAPVIHEAQDLNLLGIATRLQDLTTRAKSGALTPQDVQGGTFTISNHGVSGSLLAAPVIINQPQSAILGLGKMEKRAVVEETDKGDVIAIRLRAFVTLSIDHRVLDGYQTNKFLTVFTDTIADWRGE